MAREELESIIEFLKSSEAGKLTHSTLENALNDRGRELLRRLFQAHIDTRGPGEAATAVKGADQIEREARVRTKPRRSLCRRQARTDPASPSEGGRVSQWSLRNAGSKRAAPFAFLAMPGCDNAASRGTARDGSREV